MMVVLSRKKKWRGYLGREVLAYLEAKVECNSSVLSVIVVAITISRRLLLILITAPSPTPYICVCVCIFFQLTFFCSNKHTSRGNQLRYNSNTNAYFPPRYVSHSTRVDVSHSTRVALKRGFAATYLLLSNIINYTTSITPQLVNETNRYFKTFLKYSFVNYYFFLNKYIMFVFYLDFFFKLWNYILY